MAETPELREHKPHPVGTLAARLQLGQNSGKHRFLGGNEAFEVEWISTGQFDPHSLSLGKSKDVGRFLAEIPFPPEAPRHRHDVWRGGTDHVDLAVVQ